MAKKIAKRKHNKHGRFVPKYSLMDYYHMLSEEGSTAKDLMEKSNCSRSTILKKMVELKEMGMIHVRQIGVANLYIPIKVDETEERCVDGNNEGRKDSIEESTAC